MRPRVTSATAATFVALLGLMLAGPAGAASSGGRCGAEIQEVQARLSKTQPTSSTKQWLQERKGKNVGSSMGESAGDNHAGENWMGGAAGRERAEELLYNAGRLEQAGKDENCLELVAEARRAVGMKAAAR